MGAALELTGQRFGLLTVLDQAAPGQGYRGLHWRCVCDCGAEVVVPGPQLRRGNNRSCGGKVHSGQPLGALRVSLLLSIYKRNAKSRGIEWSLPDDEFLEIVASPCTYCGRGGQDTPLTMTDMAEANGIDRFDNGLGYVSGNCVPCCSTCNTAKSAMAAEAYVAHCVAVAHRVLQHVH